MGVFIAVIIILVLILYAMKDLLAEKDFSSWINIALTALVLFTVILSIFMILNKNDRISAVSNTQGSPGQNNAPAAEQRQAPEDEKPIEEKSDEEIMLEIAEEYTLIEDDYIKRNPEAADYEEVSSNYIKQKYGFTDEEWDNFMVHAKDTGLFDKARQKRKGDDGLDYLIKQ